MHIMVLNLYLWPRGMTESIAKTCARVTDSSEVNEGAGGKLTDRKSHESGSLRGHRWKRWRKCLWLSGRAS